MDSVTLPSTPIGFCAVRWKWEEGDGGGERGEVGRYGRWYRPEKVLGVGSAEKGSGAFGDEGCSIG